MTPVFAPDADTPREWEVPAFTTQEFAARATDYCVVIPVINEGLRIASLLSRMRALRISALADILLIDGGTTDGSLSEAMLRTAGVRTVLVKTGPGKLSAQLRCAYAYALRQGYAGIVTIDGNDKDDPDAIPGFIAELQRGTDFVQASRFIPGGKAENTPVIRDLAIRLIHAPALSFASGFHWTDTTQGFRAYSRKLLLHPQIQPFRALFERYELLAFLSYQAPRVGLACTELPTTRRYPKEGKVPTKISAVRGNLQLLKTLFDVCRGKYNPSQRVS